MGYSLEFCNIFLSTHINNRPCATTWLIKMGYVQHFKVSMYTNGSCEGLAYTLPAKAGNPPVRSNLGKFILKKAV